MELPSDEYDGWKCLDSSGRQLECGDGETIVTTRWRGLLAESWFCGWNQEGFFRAPDIFESVVGADRDGVFSGDKSGER
jgi:hypothetical protein